MKCGNVLFSERKWQNGKTSVVPVALVRRKGISQIMIQRRKDIMTREISKIEMEEITEC